MSRWIATVCGIGYIKPAAGTWGSVAALPLFWIIDNFLGLFGIIFFICLIFYLGWKAAEVYSKETKTHDASEIVIDEVIGQFIALLPITLCAYLFKEPPGNLWIGWLCAFLLFRVFDILKPGIIGHFDKDNTALSIILDDVFAGLFAAIGVCAILGVCVGIQ